MRRRGKEKLLVHAAVVVRLQARGETLLRIAVLAYLLPLFPLRRVVV